MTPTTYRHLLRLISDRQKGASPEVPYHDHSRDENELKIKFHICCKLSGCSSSLVGTCFHSNCYSSRLYEVSPTVLTVMDNSFHPNPLEYNRRWGRILRLFAARLHALWARKLPLELCPFISSYIVRGCMAASAQIVVADHEGSSDSIVDLSHNIYARYVVIDGIRYIVSLRSSALVGVNTGEKLMLKAQVLGNI